MSNQLLIEPRTSNMSFLYELYKTMKETCVFLGVNLRPGMTYFDMFEAACEKASTSTLSKLLEENFDDDQETAFLFKRMKELIFNELQKR